MTRHGAPIIFDLCFADFFSCLSAITIGAGGIGAPLVLADYKDDRGFGAPCLLSCQSPNNLS
jgi:hypothetical protein